MNNSVKIGDGVVFAGKSGPIFGSVTDVYKKTVSFIIEDTEETYTVGRNDLRLATFN